MARKDITTIDPDKVNQDIPKTSAEVSIKKTTALASDVLFSPSVPQAKVKARFWVRFTPGPFMGPSGITVEEAMRVTGCPTLKKWWGEKGFKEWFLNKEEERERIKYLFNKGLDAVEEILMDPAANPNAKANLIKMLAEMTGHLGKTKPVEKFADQEIEKMDEQQLETYLTKKGVKVVTEKVLNVDKDD